VKVNIQVNKVLQFLLITFLRLDANAAMSFEMNTKLINVMFVSTYQSWAVTHWLKEWGFIVLWLVHLSI